MKQFILLSVCILSVLCSCSDNELPISPEKEKTEGMRSITFALLDIDNGQLQVTTRAKGTVVLDNYVVMFYLFGKSADDNFQLIQKEQVRTPLYTIENIEEEGVYKYLFVATSLANTSALDAIDFTSGSMNPDDFTVILPSKIATPADKNILENCYIGYFDDIANSVPGYGKDVSTDPETIVVQKDLDIFGCGAVIQPGMVYSTPVNVLLQRQFGIVEFKFTDAQAGDKLTCSFSSEYYRLYLSQMVWAKDKWVYSSDNTAIFPENLFENIGLPSYPKGDYYSALAVYRSGFGILPIFTKSKVLSAGENSVQIYMPYTTAQPVGSIVEDIYKANYIRTELTDINGSIVKGFYGNITLTVERGGTVLNTYTLPDTSFPIYQNGKTVFTTVGKDYFQVKFGQVSDISNDGINLDPDGWHGE